MSEMPGDVTPPMPTPSTPEDAAAVARIRRWNRFYKIAIIWLIGWVGLIVEKMVKLDSVANGLHEGLLKGAYVAPFLLMLTLPLAWLGAWIGSREKWRRYRLWLIFALPTLFVLIGVAWALKGRYFPQEEFRRITGVEFPRDARIERCVFADGLVYWTKTYELTCPAEETDRLIREMKLTEDIASHGVATALGTTSKGWIMTESWRGEGASWGIWMEIQTDATRTKLRIICRTSF